MQVLNQIAGGVVAVAAMASGALAATSISYPNSPVLPPGVQFTNISESSGTDAVPLYGAPTFGATYMDFNPQGFVATSVGGGGDITDGQLNFHLNSNNPSIGFTSLNVAEAGDYTLAGVGTTATADYVGAIIRITVTAINGVAVAPLAVPTANASVGYNLIANPGVTQPWSLGLSNIINLPAGQVATGIDVVINNQLIANSEVGSDAFIAKKDFTVTVGYTPEPSSLMALAALGAGLMARRRRA